ncbi:MAG: epoxyqueuosine reductase QueH [Patescibacteria group bacterium]
MLNKLLLHTCCAPCSIAIIDELRQTNELTVFFYNPNIFPAEEYPKRKYEVIRVCTEWQVPMVDVDYEAERWEELVAPLGQGPEGGPRCSACFRLRLARTALHAQQNGFDIFATSLTMGRHKNAEVINAIGHSLGEQFAVRFNDEIWRRGGRSERGRALTTERNIYRQKYCGCRFSLEAVLARESES